MKCNWRVTDLFGVDVCIKLIPTFRIKVMFLKVLTMT